MNEKTKTVHMNCFVCDIANGSRVTVLRNEQTHPQTDTTKHIPYLLDYHCVAGNQPYRHHNKVGKSQTRHLADTVSARQTSAVTKQITVYTRV